MLLQKIVDNICKVMYNNFGIAVVVFLIVTIFELSHSVSFALFGAFGIFFLLNLAFGVILTTINCITKTL